jgi:hypothetical protein
MHTSGFQRAPECFAWCEQALLTDDLIEIAWPHALSQWFELIRIRRKKFWRVVGAESFHRWMIGHLSRMPFLGVCGANADGRLANRISNGISDVIKITIALVLHFLY